MDLAACVKVGASARGDVAGLSVVSVVLSTEDAASAETEIKLGEFVSFFFFSQQATSGVVFSGFFGRNWLSDHKTLLSLQ